MMIRFFLFLFSLQSMILALTSNQDSFTLLSEELSKNATIKQLEYEIKALESQAKSQAKWDNLKLSFAYSNAEVTMPFNPSANEMQNIAIGLEQNFDLNQKRKLQATITRQEANIKLLELKNLKNQYIYTLLSQAINADKNQKILEFLRDSLKNLDIVLKSLQTSSNFNAMQIQKLQLLKAKLQIKYNDITRELQNSHIAMSEVSFENTQEIAAIIPTKELLDSIKHESFISEVLANNYEIQIAILRDLISKDSVRLAKKSYISDLSIAGSYMFRVNRTDMFALSFSFPLPIYGKEKNLVIQSQYNNLIAQSQILDTQNRIKHTTFNLLANLKNLEDNLAIINQILLPSNQRIVDLYKHHSTSQMSGFYEFYSALNEQVDAEILKLETLAQIYTIYWNLQSIKGVL